MKLRASLIALLFPAVVIGETLQEEADAYVADHLSPASGVSIASIKADGPTAYASAGRLREEGPEITSETLFEIGSITKTFTGILLADSVVSGAAKLSDPVSTILPENVVPAESPLHKITLLELATHTSGLPRLPDNLNRGGNPADPYAHYDQKRLYSFLTSLTEKDLKNRGSVSYSNLGMGLLGHLLELIHETPYEILLSEKILAPLAMNQTWVQRPSEDASTERKIHFATGHAGDKETSHWHIDILCGAGAIVSSTEDLAKFARAHWSDDIDASLRAAIKLATKEHAEGIGLGWFVSDNRLSHDGGTGGFRSELRIDVEQKEARIFLTNNSVEKILTRREGDFSSLEGFWSGKLKTGSKSLRLVLRVSKDGRIALHSLDQGGHGIQAATSTFDGSELLTEFPALRGVLTAEKEGGKLIGIWNQGTDLPLTLTHSEECPVPLVKILGKKVTSDVSLLQGFWSGYLGSKAGLFVIIMIESIGETGEATLFSPDQSEAGIPISSLSFEENKLTLRCDAINGTYVATLGDDEKLSGLWNQGFPLPLTLVHSEDKPKRE